MSYHARIAAFSAATLALTALLLVLGPRRAPLTLVAQTPSGEAVAAGSAIRVTFSRPVDRASAEQSFRIDPAAPGSFFWEERTLTFTPSRPLAAETSYTVSFSGELRDDEGRLNGRELSWSFRTRGPLLLALRATNAGGSELWLVAPTGADARKLLDAPGGIGEVTVAPDGTRAVYVAHQGVERSALMLLDLASGATRPLVDDEGVSVAAPAWTGAGDFIAFERRSLTEGRLGAPQIWLAQPDGTLLGPLVSGDGLDSAYGPVWSPDGNSVAFVDGLSQALMVYSFFTDQVRELPASSGERPAWLPDGSALIYNGTEPGTEGSAQRLRLVTLGEAPATRALTDGAAPERDPAVAPVGEAVAFARRNPDDPRGRIWLVATGGGPARPLSAEGPHQDSQPAWSPDGRLLAFVRASAAGPLRSQAVVVDPATGVERVALEGAVQVGWAP